MSYQLALVTGATSGIGEAVCRLLAEKGIDLIISGRNEEALAFLQESLKDKVRVYPIAADLSKSQDREVLIKQIQHYGPDLVINNAGFGLYGDALTYDTSEQLNVLEVNGTAVLELTLEAARMMVSKDIKGVILNVSSAASFQIFPGLAVYAASKAFVNHVSQSLDWELKPYGIRVLTICPGRVKTQFSERAGGKTSEKNASEEGGIEPMASSYAAEQIWHQIQELKPLQIINWKYRFMTWISQCLPQKWVVNRIVNSMKSRVTPRTIKKNLTNDE